MANTKQRYSVKIGTSTYMIFSGTKAIYDGAVGGLVGVVAVGTTPPTGTRISAPVSSFPSIAKIKVKYVQSGSGDTAVYRVGTVICAPDKIEDALSGLAGKTYKGKNIVESYLGRRRVLY